MRRPAQRLRRMSLLWLCTAVAVSASNLTSAIPKGASKDEVIREVGWPKGRGSMGDREVWTYRGYRILFEKERVVDVQPTEEPPAREMTPRPAALVPNAPTPAPIRTMPQRVPSPSGIPVIRAQAPSTTVFRDTTARPVVATEVPRARPDPFQPLRKAMLISLCVFISFFALLSGVTWLKKRRRKRDPFLESPSLPAREGVFQQAGPALRVTRRQSAGVDEMPAELTVDTLLELEWKRLEELAAHLFAAQGWKAEMSTNGADGGVDVKLTHREHPERRAYVQCKAWIDDVDVRTVRELYGVMAADQIAEGWFFTTAGYTTAARAFAEGKTLRLLDGRQIVREFGALPENDRRRILTHVFRGDYRTPSCPKCGSKMELKGTDRSFWGCPRFRVCRSSPINVRRPRS